MSTLIRPEISKNNEYWIPRHRYYELKHFCLQYREWVKIVNSLDSKLPSTSCIECIGRVSGYMRQHYDDGDDCGFGEVFRYDPDKWKRICNELREESEVK